MSTSYFTKEKITDFRAYFLQVLQILARNKVRTVYAGCLDAKIKDVEIAMCAEIHQELICCVGPFSAPIKTDIDIFKYLDIDQEQYKDVAQILSSAPETCTIDKLGITDTRHELLRTILNYQNKTYTNFYGLSEFPISIYGNIKGDENNFIPKEQKYSMFQFMPRDLKIDNVDKTPVFIVVTKNDGEFFLESPFVVYVPRLSVDRTNANQYLQYSIFQEFHKLEQANKILYAFGFPQLINDNENKQFKKVGYIKTAITTIKETCTTLYAQIQAGPYTDANKVLYCAPYLNAKDSLEFLAKYLKQLQAKMKLAQLTAAQKMNSLKQQKQAAIQYAESELPPADDIAPTQAEIAEEEEEEEQKNSQIEAQVAQEDLANLVLTKRPAQLTLQDLQNQIKPQPVVTNIPQFMNTQLQGSRSTRRGGQQQQQ